MENAVSGMFLFILRSGWTFEIINVGILIYQLTLCIVSLPVYFTIKKGHNKGESLTQFSEKFSDNIKRLKVMKVDMTTAAPYLLMAKCNTEEPKKEQPKKDASHRFNLEVQKYLENNEKVIYKVFPYS
jgi:hypothetical protein